MLKPLAWLYGRIVDLRNLFYNKGWSKSFDLGARTISVGNITAGGTGKTPLVACIAEMLAANGEKICILTRGYGRENPRQRILVSNFDQVLADARTGGDEPVELARKLLGKAIVVADGDRLAAAAWAKREFGITSFVLDDGFQHRRAKRDLDIVCVDATDPLNGSLLPAGRLRERPHNLSRADAVVITRANLVDDVSNLRSEISKYASGIPLFENSTKTLRLIGMTEFCGESSDTADKGSLGQKYLAFCGIGNPTSFFRQLASDGFDVVARKPFPDHHFYKQDEVQKLEKLARTTGADALITTAKDAVKLAGLKFDLLCFVAEAEMVFDELEAFRRLITSS